MKFVFILIILLTGPSVCASETHGKGSPAVYQQVAVGASLTARLQKRGMSVGDIYAFRSDGDPLPLRVITLPKGDQGIWIDLSTIMLGEHGLLLANAHGAELIRSGSITLENADWAKNGVYPFFPYPIEQGVMRGIFAANVVNVQ